MFALVLLALAAGNDFERDLETILRASARQFETQLGARVENRKREFFFEARLSLPGATYCRIFEIVKGTTTYSCEWGLANVRSTLYEELVRVIEDSLGPAWAKSRGPRKRAQDTLFTRAGQPTIQLIREAPASAIHLFVIPAGSSIAAVAGPLPAWQKFFYP